jgi:mannan endo-1,4-beta-mannosidase
MKNFSLKKKSFLKKALAIASLGVIVAPVLALSPPAIPTWSVQGGKLLDPNGIPFVFRGVTIDHTLAPEKTLQAIKDVAALGANSAQIEFAINPTWVSGEFPRKATLEIREIIKACKDNKLVCVLEANDASGYSQSSGSVTPTFIASYWGLSDMRDALNGSQSHIIIGFSNQIFDSHYTSQDYEVRMNTYLGQLRDALPAGFMILIDGNKWGQDTDSAMLQFAQKNINSGSYLNSKLLYSIDFFDAYTDPLKARDYIASFAQLGAPLVIGGFGPVPYYHPHNIEPRPAVVYNLPAQSVMQYAEQYGAGYFGWSWSGNQNPALDLANNWDVNNLTGWGDLLFNGADGIKATATLATHFSSNSSASSSSVSSNSSSSSSSTSNNPPVAAINYSLDYVRCGQVYGNVDALSSYDPDGDSLTYRWEITGYSSPTISTESSVRFYMQPPHYYTIKLTVSDDKGASATVTTVRNHTYSDYCVSSSSSSSIIQSSSSSIRPSSSSVPSVVSSSSIRPSSVSSSSRSSSSSLVPTAVCSYVVNSQWNNGFTAAIRIKNMGTHAINRWSINWQYNDGSKVTNLWNAQFWDSGIPGSYAAGNLDWNATIQPGQTVEFGFQGTKPASAAQVPVVRGSPCL